MPNITTVSDYMKKEKKSFLGVPKFYVHGVYKQKSDSYRFMVMQRMGKDLEAIIASSHKHTLKPQFAFEVACQMVSLVCVLLFQHLIFLQFYR